MPRGERSRAPQFGKPIYFERAVIWADYLAAAVFVLVSFGLALNFVGSDAPARAAAYKSRVAKFAELCGPPKEAPLAAGAAASSRSAADPSPTASDAGPSATDAPGAAPPAAVDTGRLPDRLCVEEQMRIDADAEEARAPTLRDLGTQIGEAGLFLALPLWIGLRVFDYRTGGPMRRLARSPYWRATRDARHAYRRQRESRRAAKRDDDDRPYESS